MKIKITQFPSGFHFKLSTSHFIPVLNVLLFSFWIDWLWTKEPRFRGPYLKSRQMWWCTYINTYIVTSKNLKWTWLQAQATQAGHLHDLNIISLLQSLVASQHYWMRLSIIGRIMEIERCVISRGRLGEADKTLWDLQHLLWYLPWLVFLYTHAFNMHICFNYSC